MLKGLRHDLKIGHKEVIIRGRSRAIKGIPGLIDYVLAGDLEDRYLIQKTRMTRHMTKLLWNVQRYEQLNNTIVKKPVKFLRIMTQKHDATKNQETVHTQNDQEKFLTQRGEKEKVNMVVNLMKGMRLVATGKRQAPKTELLLTLMPSPLLQKSISVKGVNESLQISDVTSGLIWISDKENLVLTDTATGETLHYVDNSEDLGEGIHTINCKKELIYIDKDKNIIKLSEDKETTTTLIKNPDPEWILWCVYCSPSSGDILVGLYKNDINSLDSDAVQSMVTIMFNANIGKVMRYDNTGKHTNTISHNTQTIPHNDYTPRILYRKLTYITENNNGDVVVSDSSRYAVVVTSHEGIHRFSYTGPPSVPALPIPAFNDSKFSPHGICTDVLPHILVCDSYTRTVQMLDRDGQFLSYLLTKQTPGIGYIPHSLRYDVNNHVLWVGSWDNNTVSLYRYINRHLGKSHDLSLIACNYTTPG